MKGDIGEMKNIGFEAYFGPRLDRATQLRRLQRVIDTELTEKQRRAIVGYYFEKKNIPQLAREYGLNRSTVCRTLQRAERRIRLCLKY